MGWERRGVLLGAVDVVHEDGGISVGCFLQVSEIVERNGGEVSSIDVDEITPGG